MTEERQPLVSREVDLRGLPWMPIDTVRLLDSDIFALSSGDAFKAAVALWCRAWRQVPAASLPDDDRILAQLSGAGAKWRRVKELALRGFVRCSDGRLYHPVIAEKALEAWEHREDFFEKSGNSSARQQRWRERQRTISSELRLLGVTPPQGASLRELDRLLVDAKASTSPSTAMSTRDARDMPLTGTGQDKEKALGAGAPATGFEILWKTLPRRAGNNPKRAAEKAFRARLSEKHTLQEMLDGAGRYAKFVRATGKEGTEYVMRASTFLGADKPFQQPWTPPTAPGQTTEKTACEYCGAPRTGIVNNIAHCGVHANDAMDGVRPLKVAA